MRYELRRHLERYRQFAENMDQYSYESLKMACDDHMEAVRNDAAAHVITKAEAAEIARQYGNLLKVKSFTTLGM